MIAYRTIRLAASGKYLFILALLGAVVFGGTLTGVSRAASAPSIGAASAEVSENEATLKAPIRPGGLETKYEVWLQCMSCTSTEGHRAANGSIEAGHLEQEVSVHVTSLEWNSSYRFEVIASNMDGTVHGYPQTFTTGSSPPAGDTGGSGAGKPYESKLEQWVIEGAEREAAEAPRREAERVAKAKEEAERPAKEAAERATKEREIREAGERAGREAAERSASASSTHECVVPQLKGDLLAAARRALKRAHCTLGKVSRPHGHQTRLVVSLQGAKHGKRLAAGAAVAVTLAAHRK